MKIIPVIDVMGEKVVQARQGDRHNYQLLQSILTNEQAPLAVISDLLALQPFSTFYIADLDAIMAGHFNLSLYSAISVTFPTIQFYLDAGIKNKSDWDTISQYSNITPVIGSETLLNVSWLDDETVKEKSILSLDFKRGRFLGDYVLVRERNYWPAQIIAMNLDCIGSDKGPDLTLLTKIKTGSDKVVFAAGGVRNIEDLQALENQNIDGVLIASALHDGRLTSEMIHAFSETTK